MKREAHSTTAVIYARVSSREQEQEGYSLDAQMNLLVDYAQRKGLKVAHQFVEAESARIAGRTKFKEMIAFLRSSAKARAKASQPCRIVLVEKTDRITRNFFDLSEIESLIKEMNVEIHLVKEGQVLSQNSRSSENLNFGIKASVAKYYSENLSEECKKGMLEKARQGHYPSIAPIGYRNSREGEKSRLEVDSAAADFVRRIFRWYSSERLSLLQIKKRAQAEGFRHPRTGAIVHVNQIHRMLRNPIYHGTFQWAGVEYEGKHKPIISKEEFELVQRRFEKTGRKGPRGKRYEWAFTGLVRCGHCGSSMTAERKKGKYVYYHCSFSKQRCVGSYVREEQLDAAFLGSLKALEIDKDTLRWVLEVFRMSHQEKQAYHEEQTRSLTQRLALIQRRLDTAYEDLLDGRLDRASFERISGKWREEQVGLERRISSLNRADQAYSENAAKLIELIQGYVTAYESQSLPEKRKLLDFVVSNSVWKNGALEVALKKPFDLLALTIAKEREEAKKIQPDEGFPRQAEKWLGR